MITAHRNGIPAASLPTNDVPTTICNESTPGITVSHKMIEFLIHATNLRNDRVPGAAAFLEGNVFAPQHLDVTPPPDNEQ